MWKAMMFPVALGIATATSAPALAQCAPHQEVRKHLAERFKELPAAVGIGDGGQLIEVLVSQDGATWTLLVTTPYGKSCILATGESWQILERVAALPGA